MAYRTNGWDDDEWLALLVREFRAYYRDQADELCPSAPKDPERLLQLVFKARRFEKFIQVLRPDEVISGLFDALGFHNASPQGVFQKFDMGCYTGSKGAEDHFFNWAAQHAVWRLTEALAFVLELRSHSQLRPDMAQREPDGPSWTAEQFEALDANLRRLSPRERDVLRQVYWEGRTQREAAAALGLHQSTVSRVHDAALEKLRERMGGEENCDSLPFAASERVSRAE